MALILNIDTSSEIASICLCENGKELSLIKNREQKDHASWIHPAIHELMKSLGYKMNELNAIAITDGPGSYTGLRVAMSTAKGLCYALKIPFITEGTLRLMAFAATEQLKIDEETLLSPMIDARRNEVFTAMYNHNLEELTSPVAVILDDNSFDEDLINNKIYFFGSGSIKWKKINKSPNALFADIICNATHLAKVSYLKFTQQQFTDIIYSQPAYIKDFYTHNKK